MEQEWISYGPAMYQLVGCRVERMYVMLLIVTGEWLAKLN